MSTFDVRTMPAEGVLTDWAELADRAAAAPFSGPDWILAWHRAFGRGRLLVIGARRAGRLAAALPLMSRASALRAPANWHTPEFTILAEDPEAAHALVTELLKGRPRSIGLRFVDIATAGLIRSVAEPMGFRVLARVMERSPYLSTEGTFHDYVRRLPAKRRSDLNRRWRRLEEQGHVRLDVRADVDPAMLDEFFRLEDSGWKADTAVAVDPRALQFYQDVARWAAKNRLLRIAFLRVANVAVASDLAIETTRNHYLLKTGYDPAYRRFAPGKLLRREMIERAFAIGLDTYEFLGTDEPWKLEWTDVARDRLAVYAFAPSVAGRIEYIAHAYGRAAAKSVTGVVRVAKQRLQAGP